jgi:FtsP/CotA-like multicopper oxidase with cupredoxin domain
VFLENGMDSVGGITQPIIQPGETYRYEWTFRQHGTLMYHPHHDEMTQMAMGMMRMIIVHPRSTSAAERPDRDFVLMLSEWKIDAGASCPDPMAMGDFNILTMNAHCFPGTAPLVMKLGDKVRIRLGNLSAMEHHRFTCTASASTWSPPTAAQFRKARNGRKPPYWCPLAARAISSSSPMPRAIGRCTAT